MSRGFGKVERQILAVLHQQAVGLALPELAKRCRGCRCGASGGRWHACNARGICTPGSRRSAMRSRGAGSPRVKIVGLVNPKVTLQDGGGFYEPLRPGPILVHGPNLARARKHWQALEAQGYTPLPGVLKRDLYAAIGTVLYWEEEERGQHLRLQELRRPFEAHTAASLAEAIRQRRALWHQARALLDQARLQLTTLIKAPHISREHRERPTACEPQDLLGEGEATP